MILWTIYHKGQWDLTPSYCFSTELSYARKGTPKSMYTIDSRTSYLRPMEPKISCRNGRLKRGCSTGVCRSRTVCVGVAVDVSSINVLPPLNRRERRVLRAVQHARALMSSAAASLSLASHFMFSDCRPNTACKSFRWSYARLACGRANPSCNND